MFDINMKLVFFWCSLKLFFNLKIWSDIELKWFSMLFYLFIFVVDAFFSDKKFDRR